MASMCRSIVSSGADGIVIDIECRLSNNLPTMVIIGFADKTVTEAKDRLRGAFASAELELPRRRITINLAPADVPKSDTGLDLAIATAVLAASDQIEELAANQAVIGELGLNGSVRAVRGIIGKLLAGRRIGIDEYCVPLANLAQAQLVPGLRLYPVNSLRQLYEHLSGRHLISPVITDNYRHLQPPTATSSQSLSDVVGQDKAKRGLVIAAAGGHNLLLYGPPGTGKSMLIKALASLLPPLSHEEMLEVTHLSSLASKQYDQLATSRPLRSPHHSVSHIAMIGGGSSLRPGEISLSHRGILFLDEFPEFSRPTLEALRQPLEDRTITVTRTKDSATYPANFILAATANPCPCGYSGSTTKRCECSPVSMRHYTSKLSGPLLDRIDLCCDVYEVDHDNLLRSVSDEHDEAPRQQVQAARDRQAERYASTALLNGDLNNRALQQHAQLSSTARTTLNQAAKQLDLSARAYMRIIKVARTIADLDASDAIRDYHISEATAYRRHWQPV